MISTIIAVIALFGICVSVKLFDKEIRASRYGKTIVVYITIISLIVIIASIVKLIVGG